MPSLEYLDYSQRPGTDRKPDRNRCRSVARAGLYTGSPPLSPLCGEVGAILDVGETLVGANGGGLRRSKIEVTGTVLHLNLLFIIRIYSDDAKVSSQYYKY